MKKSLFKLSRVKGAPVSNDELFSDIKRVVELLKLKTIPQNKYAELGVYDCSTFIRRFGKGDYMV